MSQYKTQQELTARIKELEVENNNLKSRKKFGLVWERKPEDVVFSCKENIPVLKEVKSRKIIDGESNLNNLLIEGDNYHALSVLNYTHKGKIDVIYIDPPYNTGSSDWRYNNDYVDSNDQWRHSKWISFMENRLILARNLLSEKGFIIIAIDHYELFYLGTLCDEIFGENNRTGVVTVVHKPEGRQFSKSINPTNEYYLFYSKNDLVGKIKNIPLDEDDAEKFNLVDDIGKYRLEEYLRRGGGDVSLKINKPNCWYPIYVDLKTKDISLDKKSGYIEVLPITESGQERTWNTSKDTFEENLKNGDVVILIENNKPTIYRKYREQQIIKTHWIKPKYNATRYGTQLLDKILDKNSFSFPKSVYAVQDALKITSDKNSIVLDFFAGSGTTGHAVLELNKQDSGNRKFILCTNNENKICEEVTYERIKRVIKGYKNKKEEKIEGLNGNLSYYKTDLVDIEKLHKISDEAKIKVTYQAGEMIAVKENTLNEIEKTEWWQIFEGDNKVTAIYFKENKEKLKELIELLEKKKHQIVLYIFGWGKNEYRNEYSTKHIRIEDIPEPILEVYKEINRL
jgi:adenine-specific DNA-methyltransferase